MSDSGRVLVTGASGFIGRSLCNELAGKGWRVRAVSRQPVAWAHPGIEQVRVPSYGPDTIWEPMLDGVSHVVHLAAAAHSGLSPDALTKVNVEATRGLARACAGAKVQRMLMMSSLSVYGRQPVRIDEHSLPAPDCPYGHSKWQSEQAMKVALEGAVAEWVVLRPPLVYGSAAPGNFGRLERWLRSGWPLPLGSADHRRAWMYLENLTGLVAHALTHPGAGNIEVAVADDDTLPMALFLRQAERALGRSRSRLVPCSPGLLTALACVLGRGAAAASLLSPLEVADARVSRSLGWVPRWSVDEAIIRTFRPPGQGKLESEGV